jgi:hypothetical protein
MPDGISGGAVEKRDKVADLLDPQACQTILLADKCQAER